MLTSTRQERQLEPRYRRVLSFADVLDESIGVFRRHWLVFAEVSAIWLIPPGLLSVLITRSASFDANAMARQIQAGATPTLASVGAMAAALSLVSLIATLFYLAGTTAILVTTEEYLYGGTPRLGDVVGRTLRRYLSALLTGLAFIVALIAATIAASLILALFVIAFPISLIALLAAFAGVLVWWLQPRARTPWLKWLIVVATPFGLVAYLSGALAMSLGASVLERRRPIHALARSAQLVDGHWFRVVSILSVAALIVSVLLYVPTLLVQAPLSAGAAARGDLDLSPPELAISTATGIIAQVLFASLSSIVYAVLFVDLRNRREGTDISERIAQIELGARPKPHELPESATGRAPSQSADRSSADCDLG